MKNSRLIKAILVPLCCFTVITFSSSLNAAASDSNSEVLFEGSGTENDPWLISKAEDLVHLSESVNSGTQYVDEYFLQTANIDLAGIDWTPIGAFDCGSYFYGIYDGGGHYVENLTISGDAHNGFFGMLGGTIMNFGIESGQISGICIGSITSHSASENAAIINCYSKAELSGVRAGGIADNFNGSIINCWSDCVLEGEVTGGIVSYEVLYIANCYSTSPVFSSEKNNAFNCGTVSADELNSDAFARKLNSGLATASILGNVELDQLNEWEYQEGTFSFDSGKVSLSFSMIRNNFAIYFLLLFPFLLLIVAGIVLAVNVYRMRIWRTEELK